MQTLILAMALIRHRSENGSRWLTKWNGCRGMYELICAQRLEDEPFRETVAREVAWQLNIGRRDFLVSNMAQLNLEYDDVLPGDCDPTHIAISFYNVDLYRQSARETVEANENLAWLPSPEICQGITPCGKPLNPVHCSLINRARVIESWH